MKDGGTTVTIMVDPKGKDVVARAAKIGTFKAGQFLLVRSTTDDRGAWLEDARLDPNQDRPGETSSKPSKP